MRMNPQKLSIILALLMLAAASLTAQVMEPEEGAPSAPLASYAILDRLEEIRQITDQEKLFDLALKDLDPRVAYEATIRLDDQALLGRLAWEAPRKAVRAEAIARLTDPPLVEALVRKGDWYLRDQALAQVKDPALLTEVARTDPDALVREDAVKLLKDPAVMRDIAARDPEPRVREAAAWSIRDPETLAAIVRTSADHGVRKAALAALRDKYLLLSIAREIDNDEFREQAMMKIGDAALYQAIAMGTDAPGLRVMAIRLLNDQEIIKAIAQRPEDDAFVRAAAVERAEDPALLANLTRPAQPLPVRLAAVGRVRDAALLAKLAQSDAAQEVKMAAVGRLEDPKILARLALEDKDEAMRARATGRLNDPAALARIALGDPGARVRLEAVARIQDQDLLKKIIERDTYGEVRAKAVSGLDNSPADLFTRLAQSDPDPRVRTNATARLTDPAVLRGIILRDASASVRETAMIRLTDENTLEDLALHADDWLVRKMAVSKLKDSAAFTRFALLDSDPDIRLQALDGIKDAKALEMLLQQASEAVLGGFASSRPNDPHLKGEIARRGSEPGRTEDGIQSISDRGSLVRMAGGDPSPDIRWAAAKRILALDGLKPDPRMVPLQSILCDPALTEALGNLRLRFETSFTEKRYALEQGTAPYPPLRGKVRVERIDVRILDAAGKALVEATFRGHNAPRLATFEGPLDKEDGFLIKYNEADLNLPEICRDILKSLDREHLELSANSANKYVRSAARALLNP